MKFNQNRIPISYHGETCDRCGKKYEIVYSLLDNTWQLITSQKEGCLCLDCLIRIATKRGIHLTRDDFTYLSIDSIVFIDTKIRSDGIPIDWFVSILHKELPTYSWSE